MLAALLSLGLFVEPAQAQDLMAQGAAVIDARPAGFLGRGFRAGHLPLAVSIDWKDYRDGWGRTGRLPKDLHALGTKLAERGVDGDKPVLIYGAGLSGFGEEGRMAWLLTVLGHRRVHLLNGGFAAWLHSGGAVERGAERKPQPGHFVVRPQLQWRADRTLVQRQSVAGGAVILDVRSQEEWQGQTPYFEARGGYIPSAIHLPWQDLFDAQGRVLSAEQIHARLQQRGLSTLPITVYCTGGVRSAMAWAALRSAGIQEVRNYDGSFWEWAADRSLPVAK